MSMRRIVVIATLAGLLNARDAEAGRFLAKVKTLLQGFAVKRPLLGQDGSHARNAKAALTPELKQVLAAHYALEGVSGVQFRAWDVLTTKIKDFPRVLGSVRIENRPEKSFLQVAATRRGFQWVVIEHGRDAQGRASITHLADFGTGHEEKGTNLFPYGVTAAEIEKVAGRAGATLADLRRRHPAAFAEAYAPIVEGPKGAYGVATPGMFSAKGHYATSTKPSGAGSLTFGAWLQREEAKEVRIQVKRPTFGRGEWKANAFALGVDVKSERFGFGDRGYTLRGGKTATFVKTTAQKWREQGGTVDVENGTLVLK